MVAHLTPGPDQQSITSLFTNNEHAKTDSNNIPFAIASKKMKYSHGRDLCLKNYSMFMKDIRGDVFHKENIREERADTPRSSMERLNTGKTPS